MDQLPGFENCPDCDRVVVPTWNYCPMCGAALDFEDGTPDQDLEAAIDEAGTDPMETADELAEEIEEAEVEPDVEPTEAEDDPEPVDDDTEPNGSDIEPIDVDAYDGDEDLVLALVEANGELPQKVIHEHVPVSRPNVSTVLKRLEADGVVEREGVTLRPGVYGNVVRIGDGEPLIPEDDQEASADPSNDASDASDDDPGLEDQHTDPQAESDGDLDLSQYGETGQVVTPELLIDALAGAEAVYQVTHKLQLADREVEEILRTLGVYGELRGRGGPLERERVEWVVEEAVSS